MPARLDEITCRRCKRLLPRSAFDTCTMESGRKRPHERCRECRSESGWHNREGGASITPPNPSGLCQCGCGASAPIAKRTSRAFGHVKGHPTKYAVGHGSHVTSGPQWKVNELTGCWIWMRSCDTKGRGQVGTWNKQSKSRMRKQAHRWVYEQRIGPIPDGMTLDHLCMNPLCVNPAHLELVTMEENSRRYIAFARANGIPLGRPPK